jgi:hypothetical protein
MKKLSELSKLENMSIDYDSSVNGKSAKSLLCENWDAAKIALAAIESMVKNPIVKIVIGIIITVGNGIKGKFCS